MPEFEKLLGQIRERLEQEHNANLVSSGVPGDMQMESLRALLAKFENTAQDFSKLAQTRVADMAVKHGDRAIQTFTSAFVYQV